MNRETLKECIADAKTIRETAIASAKAALEEAFTPQLTAMFAEKLNELEKEEEMQESEMNETRSMEEEGLEETFNLDELLAELEMEEGYSMEEEGMEKESMYEENLEEDVMLEEMSDEEIEELVMKTIEDMIASGKLMAGEEAEEEEDMEDMEDMNMDGEEETSGEEETEEIDEEINIDELLAETDSLEEETKELDEVGYADPSTADLIAQVAGFLNTSKDAVMGMVAALPATVAAGAFLRGVLKGRKAEKSMEEADTKEMEETINELRKELNEVNLLNAKLLYTNKIFKAKNLTESEKIKVLNTFDKAETVKEVKLVFETLTESFKATAKKNQIKESLGSASKTIAPAAPKQPIIEANDAFARMQRLAGLKK